MLNHTTVTQLKALKLAGMAEALAQQLDQPQAFEIGFEERLALLVDREITHRDSRRLTRLLQLARLRTPAAVEDIDYRAGRGLQREVIAALTTGQWIERHQNLAVTGPTGCGKTYIACALGHQVCRLGLSTRYFRVPRLIEDIRIAHGDGRYARLMKQLANTELLILDDFGIHKLNAAQRNDLMEVVEERHEKKSTLIASQLPVEHWHDAIGEATLADAILDRLLHRAHRIAMTGDSMRKTAADLTDRDRQS